jgi:hypothetical protein
VVFLTTACEEPATSEADQASASEPLPEYRVQAPLRLDKPIPNLTWLHKNECPLVPAIEHELGASLDVQDCGHLPVGSVNSMFVAAQACVLEAQRAGRAFRLTAVLPSYDSIDSAGFVGRGREHRPVFIRRSSNPVASWKMRATRWVYDCTRLVAREGCVASSDDLCLDCEGWFLRHDVCQMMETF